MDLIEVMSRVAVVSELVDLNINNILKPQHGYLKIGMACDSLSWMKGFQ